MATENSVKGDSEMTREGTANLADNVLVGFTNDRGNAWWNSRGTNGVDSKGRENHFPGAIPPEVVRERLYYWQAVSSELFVPNVSGGDDDPEFLPVPERQAILRSDNGHVMGIFKAGYTIHQYDEWLMGTIATILDDDLSIGSAGLLQNGAVGWVSVEVPENIVTPEGVEFRPNLFGVTSHNGTMATMFKRCVTNIVCDNTLNCARNEAGQQIKVKHTRNSGFKIATARDALAVVHSAADDFAAEVAALSAVKVTPRQFSKFLDTFSPVPKGDDASKRAVTLSENRRAILTNLWKSDPRVHPWAGTGFGVLQMVNTFDQHFTTVRQNATSDEEKAFQRWERSIVGSVNGDLDKRTDEVLGMLAAVTK
jgi:phage/plasmid-like protein (TIGR03299 family)